MLHVYVLPTNGEFLILPPCIAQRSRYLNGFNFLIPGKKRAGDGNTKYDLNGSNVMHCARKRKKKRRILTRYKTKRSHIERMYIIVYTKGALQIQIVNTNKRAETSKKKLV